MSIADQIAQAKYEISDIREAMDLAMADERWRDVAKYAQQMAETSERITRLTWASESKGWSRYTMLGVSS